jgi:hypothetical protein
MSWPKLNDQWKTLLILMQVSRGSRKCESPKREENEPKVEDWIPSFPISKDFGIYLMVKDVGRGRQTSPLDSWWQWCHQLKAN